MNKEFVKKFMDGKSKLRETFKDAPPTTYDQIVRAVIDIINPHDEPYLPSLYNFHIIDDGDYQGTIVYIIGEADYQPSNYWYVKVEYGSCSVCDTLLAIQEDITGSPTSEQLDAYMTLALYIVQGLKELV